MRLSLAATAATVASAAVAVAAYRRRRPGDDLSGEVALVTGSSRGLGLLIATELAGRGCRLLLCARDGAELERAAGRLRAAGAEVAAVACDVTREESAGQLVDAARERYGRLDILVNNAGIIRVGPVQSTSPADYEAALATMAMAPVRLALAALPVMRAQGHGRIVTITSIGGKLSVPHLLPYSTAKFAAAAFSEGLRAELGRGPVTVTTVVPGLMRTGSHVRAEFAGRKNKEFTWFSLGASIPLVSMDAERAARQIVAAVAARRPEVFLTPAAQVVGRLAGLAPEVTAPVLHAVQNTVLPAPDNDGAAVPGRELHPTLPASVFGALTSLGRAAAARFNELGRSAGPDDENRGSNPAANHEGEDSD
jgi:short-subunit dehydrogenase